MGLKDTAGIASDLIEYVRNTHTVNFQLPGLMKGRRCMNNKKHG
jgi:hypothetical protein